MISRNHHRRAWMAGTALAAVISTTAMAQTAPAAPVDFQIAAGDLGDALGAYAKQAGVEIFYQSRTVAGRRTSGLTGAYAPRQALDQLLAGTGLVIAMDQSGAMIVQEPAGPQGGSAAGNAVQALIVTAQKREEDIQDVPIAISAFSQEDLTRSQVAGGPDLMTQVPNMTFTKTNFSSYSVQIRGIGTQAISATTDPAVAIAFNNTPFVRNRFFEQEFYDLERVEVLRGPQGTLYGRNATAGVVNIISAKPKFYYEAKASADVANYQSTRVEGMINLPLVEDMVALRVAGAWTKRDGFATNELTGRPIDGRDLWSSRVSLRFTPTDAIDANLIWEHFEENDDRIRSGKQLCKKHVVTDIGGYPVSPNGRFPTAQATYQQSQLSQGCVPASLYSPDSFETPNGFQFGFYYPLGSIGLQTGLSNVDPYANQTQSHDLRVIESMVDPRYMAENNTVELQVNVDLTDTLTLTSETAWASDLVWSTQDYNRFNTRPGAWKQFDGDGTYDPSTSTFPGRRGVLEDGVFCDPQIGCSDRLVVIDLSTGETRQFSQEFRLASDYEGPFNFSLGANFTRLDSIDKYYVLSNSFTLWAAGHFSSGINAPYVGGVSDNHECFFEGFETISLEDRGGVGSAGNCRYIDPNPLESLNDLSHTYFLSKNPYKLVSYAVFGEAYYQVADNLKVTAGLRWTVDKKDAPRIPSWVLAADVGYPVAEIVDQEWREPTGRLTIDWKPDLAFTDESLLYASYAHGYKAGGANPPVAGVALNAFTGTGGVANPTVHKKGFDAEFVDAFEVGTKNTLFGGRMTLNLGAFYYDYKDYQISQIIDRSAINSNFDATVWGLELEADWRPLDNLRLGLKLGYEDTKVGDGEKAIDVMDRSDGNRADSFNGVDFHWIVVKPFPIYPSNCVMPDYLWLQGMPGSIEVNQVGNVAGSGESGPCDVSYYQGLDIFTMQPYEPFPAGGPGWTNAGNGATYPNYPGYDPSIAPNFGAGFDKDLSGNELPNAPHYTATITADYTIPLPNDWLATLHTDLYYQSEAWTRIFNMEGYDKLKAYTNVNIAAIFTNEDAGWNVMAYVKNVMDRDSITGAFLNSDDTGLTTNVFLTEPRLYGVRITKDFTGGPWWTGANPNHPAGEPYPFTLEIGGQLQRHEAPYEAVKPGFAGGVPPALDLFGDVQNTDLDWGDGRDAKLTYRPAGSPWSASLGVRYGRTNGSGPFVRGEEETDKVCGMTGTPYDFYCDPTYLGGRYYDNFTISMTNWATARSGGNREDHQLVDFMIGRDIGLGALERSTVSAGMRYAQFKSRSGLIADTVPDWYLPEGWFYQPYLGLYGNVATHSRFQAVLEARREFQGEGAMLSWDASARLWGGDGGRATLDWSLTGGALFGKQTTDIVGVETTSTYETHAPQYGGRSDPLTVTATDVAVHRSRSVTVPTLGATLGLSYEVGRIRIGAGYRWERYYDVLDVGDRAASDADRAIDGPYFKIAVGFGG